MATQLQVRNDTAANWTSANPTLLSGEIGFETDTGKFKIGTGATAWTSLPYGTANLASPPAIGNTTPAAGSFTTLSASSTVSGTGFSTYLASPPAIGGTVAAAGTFTTMTATTATATTVTATAGQGFSNVVVFTSGSSATWNLPAALQVTGAKFKVTVVGAGGQGGGTAATAGHVGNGGGAGGVAIKYLTYVAGQNTATYTVGTAGSGAGTNTAGNNGTASTFIYNSVTYTGGLGTGGATSGTAGATGGAGGAGTNGDINITGQAGYSGGVAAATLPVLGVGGSAPLGLGLGGPARGTTGDGNVGSGYGAGGSGGFNSATATARAGGAGTGGIIIIEY